MKNSDSRRKYESRLKAYNIWLIVAKKRGYNTNAVVNQGRENEALFKKNEFG